MNDAAGTTHDRFTMATDRRHLDFPKERSSAGSAPFTFVQLADTQLGLLSSVKHGQGLRRLATAAETISCGFVKQRELIPVALDTRPDLTGDEAYGTELQYAQRSVQVINSMRPRPAFVIVCGDLVNTFPPTKPDEHTNHRQEKEVQDFKRVFAEVQVPLVCVCGNHDVGNRPNAYTIDLWTRRFGDDYFSFWVERVKFLVLNTQLYKDGSGAPELADAQDRWLDRELQDAQSQGAQFTVVFSHIPPFIWDPDEPDGYFPLSRPIRSNLLHRLASNNVTHWFCGHYHRNAGGLFRTHDDQLEVVTTAAIGTNLTTDHAGDDLGLSGIGTAVLDDTVSGMRIVNVSSDKGVVHRFVSLQELEQ
mmetsp:Transcript_36669/g.79877  ORF Transcript_36669/g.79877 Transcript_36669/m.79877 type:complete len:362 (-) Transcript_36669:125-1210(-)